MTSRSVLRCAVLVSMALATVACGDDAVSTSASATGGSTGVGPGGATTTATTVTSSVASSASSGPVELPTGRFRIGAWCGPPEASISVERMQEMADAGFTNANFGCEGDTMSVDYNLKMLDYAQQVGMDAAVWDIRMYRAVVDGEDIENNLGAVVADYKDHPALSGYFVIDEPTGPFTRLADVVKGMQERDPVHDAHVNLFPTYANSAQLGYPTYDAYVGGFFETAEPRFVTFDDYPFLTTGDGSTFYVDIETMRQNAHANGARFGQFIQSSAFAGHRTTNLVEKLWQGTQTLAYGGSAIYYFTYWTLAPHWGFAPAVIDYAGNQTAQYGESKYINERLQAYGRYLVAAGYKSTFHNGALPAATSTRVPFSPVYVPNAIPITIGLFDVNDGAYAFLANRAYTNAIETDVWVASNGIPEILDVASGKFVALEVLESDPVKGQRVHVAIDAADGALLHLLGPVPEGAPGAEAMVGTVRGDTVMYDVVDSTFGDSYLTAYWWHTCTEGFTEFGGHTTETGFWFCVRNDLVDHTFYFGNVVADQAMLYKAENGTGAVPVGAESWDTCPTGTLIGRRFESNGFWLCMD